MHRLLFVLLTSSLAGSLPPQDQSLVAVNVAESVVYIGRDNIISIWAEVKVGYHVQANKPNDELLIPTTLEVNGLKGITIKKQEFPPDKQFKLEGTDTFLNVYDGKFLIKLFLSPAAETQTGSYVLDAKLRYQACDDRSCLFPRIIDFSIPIEVKPIKH